MEQCAGNNRKGLAENWSNGLINAKFVIQGWKVDCRKKWGAYQMNGVIDEKIAIQQCEVDQMKKLGGQSIKPSDPNNMAIMGGWWQEKMTTNWSNRVIDESMNSAIDANNAIHQQEAGQNEGGGNQLNDAMRLMQKSRWKDGTIIAGKQCMYGWSEMHFDMLKLLLQSVCVQNTSSSSLSYHGKNLVSKLTQTLHYGKIGVLWCITWGSVPWIQITWGK